MQIVSEIVNIPNNGNPTTEYVLSELKKMGITPLRWAIVKITNETYTVNCAYDKD
jgi:hypothetical protein